MSGPDSRTTADYLAVGAGRPGAPQPYLPRPRLHALLDAGVERAVTVLRAGPGWGKTTLVAAWAAQRPECRIAWLTVRHRHTTVAALTGGITAALLSAGAIDPDAPGGTRADAGSSGVRAFYAGSSGVRAFDAGSSGARAFDAGSSGARAFDAGSSGVRAFDAGSSGDEPEDALLRRLVSASDRARGPTVLVLDDLHVLDGSPAMRALAAVVARQPAGLRLVLLSRSEPALPLDRPGIADAVSRLGVHDLALDDGEAAGLAALYGGADPAVGEGWPLGLRLAAGTAGPDAIDDYLWREVVAVQPSAVRRFLLRTSIVDEMSAPLAEALTGVVDSRGVLDGLERDLGFVTSREGEPRRFRCHGQLRAMLRRRLELATPDEVGRLHAVAARWYAAQRSVPEALWHAAEAGDWVYLGRLVAELAMTRIVSAERRLVVDAVQRIPPEFLPATAELSLCAALLMLFTGDYAAIPEWIGRARAMLAGREPDQRRVVEVALDSLEAPTVVRIRGDMPGLVVKTTSVLDRLRTASAEQIPMLLPLRAIAMSNKGVGLLWTERLDQAERYLWAGLRASRSTGLELVELNAEGHLALLAYLRGALGAAEKHALAARRLADRIGVATTAQAAAAHLVLALVEVERDRIPEAQARLRDALHVEANPPEASLAVISSIVLVHLLLAADDPAAAESFLRQVRHDGARSLNAPMLQRWLSLVESEIDLEIGAPERVAARYRSRPAPSPAEQALLGRALGELGDTAAAEELLTRAAAGPDRIAAVQALIGLGLLVKKSDFVERAAALAEPDGIRRPFRRLHPRSEPAPEHRPTAVELADPLSERETEVLRFLPSVLTAQEIADDLGVSVNTVKAHMRAIYRKLGAGRRREAVDTAHRIGLL